MTTPTRSWTVQRRYNDFVALNAELKASTGKAPPVDLPSKHSFRLISRVDDPHIIAERQSGLEGYLKAILSSKDGRWRNSFGFADFIALASNTGGGGRTAPSSTANRLSSVLPDTGPSSGHDQATTTIQFTSASWLTEHATLQSGLRNIRSSLLKRDALAQIGDASASRSAGVEAKRAIKDTKHKLEVLERGLASLEGLGMGERHRREGLVGVLKDELNNLEKMAEVGIRISTINPPTTARSSPGIDRSATSTPGNDTNRSALFGGTSSAAQSTSGIGRVFGSAASTPQETAITRPLDDSGLIHLQKTQMDNQDDQLQALSEVLIRQRRLGEDIGREVGEQNEMLDGLATDLSRTTGKMGRAKRELNK